jgi:hypothetical protein
MSQTELQHIDRPLNVGAQVQDRITVGADERDLTCNMKNSVEAFLADLLNSIKLSYIRPRVVRAGWNVTQSTGGFIINNHDVMTTFYEAVGYVGADEASSSCD